MTKQDETNTIEMLRVVRTLCVDRATTRNTLAINAMARDGPGDTYAAMRDQEMLSMAFLAMARINRMTARRERFQ